jgi:hypothetical protein
MGLFKRIAFREQPSSSNAPETNEIVQHRKKSIISLVPLSEVTEASLKVWRQLPGTIRQDPSMASFQLENERWKGICKMIA